MSTPVSGLSAGFPAGPRTPEPGASFATAGNDAPALSPPSPPRRMRLKRRAAPRLSAPTQNFLASVAAADVPIPSIEVPDHGEPSFTGMLGLQQHLHQPPQHHQQHLHQGHLATEQVGANFLSVNGRAFSPPKTPAPGVAPSTSTSLPSRYPDWSIDSVFSSSVESSPDPEGSSSSRPSTARSTQTSSSSLFSRFSQLSDDDHCLGPEEDAPSKLSFGLTSHFHELRRNSASGGIFSSSSSGAAAAAAADSADNALLSNQRRRARKPALTKAMSAHLWATYILYLQDPKVTPFRVGKSCVPPHGVLMRVAREAKRSWKGAKAMSRSSAACSSSNKNSKRSSSNNSNNSNNSSKVGSETAAQESQPAHTAFADVPAVTVSSADNTESTAGAHVGAAGTKSGSSTPTATGSAASSTYMEWPFTNAATRAHLRELCRLKAATPGGGARGLQYMSRSPTPFTLTAAAASTRHRNMRVAPDASRAPSNATSNAPADAPVNAPSNFNAAPSSTFGTKDMALSLVLSTSETMQPHGPLAQLTRVGRDRAYSSYNSTISHSSSHSSRSAHRSHRSLGSHLYHPSGAPSSIEASLAAALGTSSSSAPSAEMSATASLAPAADVSGDSSFADRRRLGSPFTARSYGPSSSTSLAAVLGLSTTNTRQPHTVGPRRSLQSPVRISRTSTQKTRRTKHLSQDLRRRPGLGTDFFTEPSAFSSFGFPCGPTEDSSNSVSAVQNDGAANPRIQPMPSLTSSSSAPQLTPAVSSAYRACEAVTSETDSKAFDDTQTAAAPSMRNVGDPSSSSDPFGGSLLGAAPSQPPARLGSPFALPETSTSFSFPNRLFQSTANLDMAPVSRPFATVQRAVQPKAGTVRTDLASRLAYLDQRLREINGRGDNTLRRSDSPSA